VERQADDELMENCRKEEDDCRGAVFAHAQSKRREVHMPHQPLVHRHVPKPPVFVNGGRVPPAFVKLPVAESRELSENVQPEVEQTVEAAEPHVQGRDGQLENAFEEHQECRPGLL